VIPSLLAATWAVIATTHDGRAVSHVENVLLVREGRRTVVTYQTDYRGPAEPFAVLLAVPSPPLEGSSKVLSRGLFARLDRLTAPVLVEELEVDPCGKEPPPPRPHKAETPAQASEQPFELLDLKKSKWRLPPGAEEALRAKVEQGWSIVSFKLDPAKLGMKHGELESPPLRVAFESDTFEVPMVGRASDAEVHDLLVYVLARHTRYEAATRPNALAPTGLDLRQGAARFTSVYASLFDRTREGGKIVTEHVSEARGCEACLSAKEILGLGADVLPAAPDEIARPTFGSGFVITRLHGRWSAGEAPDALVLRAAATTTHQPRFVIRRAWEKPVACDQPVRGRWAPGKIIPALGVTTAPRADVTLENALKKEEPEPPPPPPAPDPPVVPVVTKARGCGCSVADLMLIGLAGVRRLGRRSLFAGRRVP
jgi:hypothetical protein